MTTSIRNVTATMVASDVGVTLRNIQGFAFESVPPAMVLRNLQGFAFEKVQFALPLSVAGNLALYQLINNNSIYTSWSASNSTLGTPAADSTHSNCNTVISLTAQEASGYSGSINLYYNRQPLSVAISASISLGSIPAATTIWALLPTINTKYSLNLTTQDVVNGTVPAGAVAIVLTAASGSWLFQPGSTAVAGQTIPLTTATPNTALGGFANAAGVGPKMYQNVVLGDSPYAYYRLNELSGTVAADSSGNGRNGTYTGASLVQGATSFQNATGGTYPQYPGSAGNYVDITASKNFCSGTQWSFEAWVDITAISAENGANSALSASLITDTGDTGSTSPATGFDISMLSNWSVTANCLMFWQADNKQVNSAANTLPALGTVAHIVVTYNAGTVCFYVNGSLVGTSTTATPATIRNFLRLGANSWSGGPLNGSMGEVALYTTALTPVQIGNHYSAAYNAGTVTGQVNYMVPGTYSLVVPQGVKLLSGVAIAGGVGGWAHSSSGTWGRPGAGAGLGWKNNIPVTPGETLTVVVGAPGTTTTSTSGALGTVGGVTQLLRGSTVLMSANSGNPAGGNSGTATTQSAGGTPGVADGGGTGGNGTVTWWQYAAGGGGAGGYNGPGGAGGGYTSNGGAGSGGGAGGGSGSSNSSPAQMLGGAGGGTGLYGLGTSGATGAAPNVQQDGLPGSWFPGSGMFGGGASNGWTSTSTNDPAQGGGLRLIWGSGRAYPSTLCTDQNYNPVQGGPADILAHFEGSNSGTYGFDTCGSSSAGIFGSAAYTTAAAAFGTQSVSLTTAATDCIYFNARGQTDRQVTGDFTFDIFLSKKSGATLPAGNQGILCDRQPGTAPYGVPIGVAASTQASMAFYMSSTGELMANIFGQTGVDLGYNLWNNIPGSGAFVHVAIQVHGLVLQVFVAGKLVATYTGTTRAGATWTPQINIGNVPALTSPLSTCYIDEVRFVNGLARYTSAGFTAPTQAFWMG
jgi:hypothetical protein